MVLIDSLSNSEHYLIELARTCKKLCQQPDPGPECETEPPVRQRQKRLAADEVGQLIAAHRQGTTVYDWSRRFGCSRQTASKHLRTAGIKMRLTPLSAEHAEEAVRLYESGISLARVGNQRGATQEQCNSYSGFGECECGIRAAITDSTCAKRSSCFHNLKKLSRRS